MKNILFTFSMFIISIGIGFAQNATGLPLQLGKQRIVVQTGLTSAQEGERVFIVAGREEGSAEKGAKSYGIQAGGKGKNILSQPLLELLDASTKRVLRKITVDEFFGKGSDGWKYLPDESVESAGKMVSAFSFTIEHQPLKFYRTIEYFSDDHLPGTKGVTMIFAIVGEKAMQMNMRFIAACEGVSAAEGNSCMFGDSANEQASLAMIVMLGKQAASITFEKKKRKGEPTEFIVESVPVNLSPKVQTTLMTLVFTGTSVGQPVHAAKQAHNLMAYLTSQSSKPDLIALTRVNRPNTTSGDTVLYTIDYHNIGTAAGKDVEISNPIASGTRYVENSGEGEGSMLNYDRSLQGDVTSIHWKFAASILPGEHRLVKFKVVVQ